MKLLYNKQAKEKLENIKKNNFIVLFVLLFSFILVFILSLVLSSYHTKVLFQIIASILLALLGCALVYFIARALYLKNIYYDFSVIEESEDKKVIGKVEECSKKLITLPDKNKVYEVRVSFKNETGKVFSLSEIFDPEFEIGKTYKFSIVSDYIKGYEEYEN